MVTDESNRLFRATVCFNNVVRVEIQQTASFCDTILLLNSYCKSGFCGGNGECKVTLYTETWTFHKILFKYNKNSTNKK